jgi:perosamine synthetase
MAIAQPPTIAWWTPELGDAERARVLDVLDSNFLNDGEVTTAFEQALAQRLGCRHVVTVTSGTTALYLALAGLGIGHGDEVLVPDITFIATANAVTMTGARPVLVDVDPATLNMAPEAAAAAITPRTRAIMPVHVSGRAADMHSLLALAGEHGLRVVEDAAEAFMSRLHGRPLGTFGDAGCFSFSPNKTITTGQGGAICTNDDALAGRLRALKDQGRPERGTGGDDLHPSIGFNFKFTNLQAAVGMAQLERLDARLARQQRSYELYAEALADVTEVHLPGFDLDGRESPQWIDALVERRDALDRFLADQGMHCRRFWFPLHTQAPYRLPDAAYPHSTRSVPRALWLPSSFTLSDSDVAQVCQAIRAFYS